MDDVNGGVDTTPVEAVISEVQISSVPVNVTVVIKPKRIVTPETREKMRLAKVGKPSPMKGKVMPESAKERIRQARLGKTSNRIIGKSRTEIKF
jgi:hypothetical protein